MSDAANPGPRHVPVLPVEVLELLALTPGQIVVDATLGAGGHARLLAERITPSPPTPLPPGERGREERGRLIALDRDPAMIELARPRLEGLPVTVVRASFDQLRQVLDDLRIDRVDAVLADLGVSSDQLDDAARGFSFQQDAPLDMRMNPMVGETAADLLRRLNERDLADIFYEYGEERFSRRIARKIVEVRQRQPVTMTGQLAELIRRCVPRPGGKRRHTIDPATRVFQALRIAVNDELSALEGLLGALPRCLKPGGRAAIISFHSLEDRRVKQAFRDRSLWEALTRKPVEATDEEVQRNPRARSAKLRVARRI
ncbi:MAG TPA: 16S rRNA (cytosine(1402)-N(4))-methyltransferase RsmH [Gemmataceae bacterium]|nr:16S rRNA (cytosine(1402)-N(4))-methyltransferase RsmH [Gemmataceae bacterium]